MRKKFIAGNWKMNGTLKSARALLSDIVALSAPIKNVECAVFPPFVHLPLCAELLSQSGIHFGAQTVSEYANGAFTGEISATQLQEVGCRYVIIGHSERRHVFGETKNQITQKCIAALNAGLMPILCVGETLGEREKNATLSVVQEQLEVVAALKDNCATFKDIIIAYEPVWAIGTGKTATPQQAQDVHAVIRAQLPHSRILYGGSVKPNNAKALFAMKDIDGALIGGASLDAKDFIEIAKQCPCP